MNSVLREFRRRLAVLLHRDRFDRELAEEIQSHQDLQSAENRENGMDPDSARDAARRQFGNATLLREDSAGVWGWSWLEALARDTRYALRTLHRNPGFTAVAILTLAFGLGANLAIFTLVQRIVLQPVAYHDVDRLMDVHLILTEQRRGTIPMSWSYPKFELLLRRNRSFQSLAVFQDRDIALSGVDLPERVNGELVSAQYFRMIGVHAALGRVFVDQEDQPGGADPVVLISDGLWTRQFQASPRVLGRAIRVDGVLLTIAGVLPPGFRGESGQADLWVPMASYFAGDHRPGWREHNLMAIGRLKPGVNPRQADQDVRAIALQMEREHPTDPSGADKWSGGAVPLLEGRVDPVVRKALWILQAATLCVLLIGCVNLANLLLSRGLARRRELAIRLSLGTSRAALIRQLLVEPVLLSLSGGVAGLFLAAWGVKMLGLLLPAAERDLLFRDNYTRWIDPASLRISWPLMALGILLAAATGLAFGLLPAWHATRSALDQTLRGGLTSSGPRHLRLRNLLVTVQMTLALVLLAAAGLMLRSFAARLATRIGAETRHIVTLQTQPASHDIAVRRAFYEELRRRAASLPGVEMAAFSDGLPSYGPDWGTTVKVEGRDGEIDTGVYRVSPEYFRLFRIPLVAGRSFDDRDREGSPLVVVLSAKAARRFFPGQNPVGRHMDYPSGRQHPGGAEVIGVVGDVKYGPPEAKDRVVTYTSTLQDRAGGYLAVRTSADPLALVAALRQQIRMLDREAPVYDVRTMEQQAAMSAWRPRLTTVLLSLLAGMALLLAALGIYGVFSYRVAARTHDIGIRMALGARRGAVLRMVLGEAAGLCAIALGVGLPAAFLLTRVLSSQLYRVKSGDPLTFLAGAVLLTAVALLACFVPARRAMRIDPVVALRYE
jgi:putative ABC transport system permease protein